jgi:hypothetical protein
MYFKEDMCLLVLIEEYALVLKETNCADLSHMAALNVYHDIARGK